jgi:hypothetical protein
MKLFVKRRARKAEERRIAAIQTACEHKWAFVEIIKAPQYFDRPFTAMLRPGSISRMFKYQCPECGKVKYETPESAGGRS